MTAAQKCCFLPTPESAVDEEYLMKVEDLKITNADTSGIGDYARRGGGKHAQGRIFILAKSSSMVD